MAELTTKQRNNLPDSAFVFPETRKYPIHDKSHGRAALQMVAKHGTPEEQAKVKAAVKAKFPDIGDPDKDEEMQPSERIGAWRERKRKGK